MDKSWQTFNMNTVQGQQLLLLEQSSYHAILFCGYMKMLKPAPDTLCFPTKSVFGISSL